MDPKKARQASKKAMTERQVIKAIASYDPLIRPKVVKFVLGCLRFLAYQELRFTEKFVIPHLATLKVVHKADTKAGKKVLFGREMDVKAKAARKKVKAVLAFPTKVAARCANNARRIPRTPVSVDPGND